MKQNVLKTAIQKGKVVFGPFMKTKDPSIVEIAGIAGFNFVIIDMEHGPVNVETAESLIRAAEVANVTPIIRVGENNPTQILRALDIGAQGVEVPYVSTKEDALRVVQAVKFAPKGNRGVCRFVRAAKYSALDRYEYFNIANENAMVIIHIEGIEGVKNLKEILTVKGLDIVFLGPYDLSSSCGFPGQVEHPLVVGKMKESVKLAKKANIAVGTFVDEIEAAKRWIEAGVQYISFSVDVGIFYNACCEIVEGLKNIPVK